MTITSLDTKGRKLIEFKYFTIFDYTCLGWTFFVFGGNYFWRCHIWHIFWQADKLEESTLEIYKWPQRPHGKMLHMNTYIHTYVYVLNLWSCICLQAISPINKIVLLWENKCLSAVVYFTHHIKLIKTKVIWEKNTRKACCAEGGVHFLLITSKFRS